MKFTIRFNPTLAAVPRYQPGRPIEEVARELGLAPEAVIKLASNENPLGPSPRALAALRNGLDQVHLYPDGNAYYLKQRLAEKLDVDPRHLALGNGSNEILELIGHALLGPGTDVVVSDYAFAVYPIVTHLFGANLITVPARDYGHDLPAMRRAITPRTRVVFVAQPNNPTGVAAPEAEIQQLVEDLPPGVLLVMDEAYREYQEKPLDLLPWVREGRQPHLVLARTFSKIYGLAGLRLGYAVGHPDLISALDQVRAPFNVNRLAQEAALAALDDREHLERTRANNAAGMRAYEQAFRAAGMAWVPSAANFILVRVGDGQRVFERMQERGVIVRPMGGYRLPEWVRITVGTPAENERCIAALLEVMASI
ncbi:MAG TPA: histidinol-phosphate transaminase [Candidatus Paceibacterota bacterium]|nr:histidinol-phosphate transaminase [Verrucomicrobiota bacterium]HOX04309.1 histidinol-phosphate transaminase [Verrucomicrobiota bacterium]HRZ47199.1 histidinol-phosphate transaminase [Candidatus Paceibacterota bacterium]HRZ93738.1 histidinol-phosphate transaminase [Candidatus Paceibacterota bacterium]